MFRTLALAALVVVAASSAASAEILNVTCQLLPGGLSVNINRAELTIDTAKKSVRIIEHSTLDNRARDRTWTNHKANRKDPFDMDETVLSSADGVKWGDSTPLHNAYQFSEKIMTSFEGAAKYQCKDAN